MRPLCFTFEAEEETKIKVITMRRKWVDLRNFYCRKSILCCWDVHVLLHQTLLIYYFFFNKEEWLHLNNIQTTGARQKFHFGCCMLFCICTRQARVTRSDPELLHVFLNCEAVKSPHELLVCRSTCKPTQALPCAEIERNSPPLLPSSPTLQTLSFKHAQ